MSEEERAKFPVGDIRKGKYAKKEFQEDNPAYEDITGDRYLAGNRLRHFVDALERVGISYDKLATSDVLEIGSGTGVFLDMLQEASGDAMGIDANPRGEVARHVVKGRAEDMAFDDESFDIVVSVAAVDEKVYEQDPVQMEKEIARVLKPGGVYVEMGSWDRLPGKALALISERPNELVYKKI